MKLAIAILSVLVILLLPSGKVPPAQNYPINYELTCPSGMFPISGPTGTTYNQVTAKYRASTCIDQNGLLSSATSISYASGASGNSVAGQSITIAAQNSSQTGSANGGSIQLQPGTGTGGGINGQVVVSPGFYFFPPSFTFAQLGTPPAAGAIVFCSDCTIANPCASGGGGALAKRIGSAWVCN